jgi:hypothetical protein
MCVPQVLLSDFKTNSIDDDVSGVKVVDFRLVVGTTPYMVSHAPSTCSSKILAHF